MSVRLLRKSAARMQKEFVSNAPIPKYIEYDARWSAEHKIIAWRTSVGLSQRNLAKLSGVCFQSIVRWEKGQRLPKPKYFERISQTIISYADIYFQ